MVTTIISVDLPVDEKLQIKKNTIHFDHKNDDKAGQKRFSLLTGLHGDELEGQVVCYEVQKRINAEPENFFGVMDIYPALNPLGIDSITRGIPAFDLDMNRTFPGETNGTMTEYIASKILEDVRGSDFALDVHASSIYIREVPQVRIPPKFKEQTIEYAKTLNMDLIWAHTNTSVQENSLCYTLNQDGTPSAVIDMGIGMNYTPEYTTQLTEGIFCLLKKMGMWKGKTIQSKNAVYSEKKEDIGQITSKCPGFFERVAKCGAHIKEGEIIGRILNPLEGKVREEVKAPVSGLLFTMREYPIVETGSMLGRILK